MSACENWIVSILYGLAAALLTAMIIGVIRIAIWLDKRG